MTKFLAKSHTCWFLVLVADRIIFTITTPPMKWELGIKVISVSTITDYQVNEAITGVKLGHDKGKRENYRDNAQSYPFIPIILFSHFNSL